MKIDMTTVDRVISIISVSAFIIGGAAIGYIWYTDHRDKKPKVVTEEQIKDPQKVEKVLDVSPTASREIVREIERTTGETPQISYYVTAPTVEKGADKVEKQITTKSASAPAAVTAKSDRTVVVPNETQQKVDVYKINLRKAHKIRSGVTYVNDHSYFTIGYQAGRWEGLMHFDWQGRPQGGTVMYTIKEW